MTDTTTINTHPVQVERYSRKPGRVRIEISMRAYEVYCHLYGEQAAMGDRRLPRRFQRRRARRVSLCALVSKV